MNVTATEDVVLERGDLSEYANVLFWASSADPHYQSFALKVVVHIIDNEVMDASKTVDYWGGQVRRPPAC
jgi:hypothetical protein